MEEAGGGLRGVEALRLHRRRKLVLGLLVVVAVGQAFIVAGLFWSDPVSVEQAVVGFRAAGADAARPAPGLPVPGVYRYRTTGGETVSFLRYRRDYSPITTRTVTRRGCGVREVQLFLAQHLEYYDRCGAALVGYGTDIAYWWTHGTQDFRCGPGSFDGSDLAAGGRAEWRCADEDTRARQITEHLGEEEVEVDGARLRARHTRWTTIFSGATTGSAVVDDWFDLRTGLVLRETRNIALRVGSPFVGSLDYRDVSTYDLLSQEPLR